MADAILPRMATTETRRMRGRRIGKELQRAAIGELATARISAGVSQATLARQLGINQSEVSRILGGKRNPTFIRLSELASLLGLQPALRLFRVTESLRDAGQQKLIARFRSVLSKAWHVAVEAPFPTLGDLRSWDLLLRLGSSFRVGVEAETRVRDIQELVRRIRQRELHGGVDVILIVLSDTAHNRALADDLRDALGDRYCATQGDLMEGLRAGRPLKSSGVILL